MIQALDEEIKPRQELILKKPENNIIIKSSSTAYNSYAGSGYQAGWWELININQALAFYQEASPVWDAIDRIATEMASIEPLIFDKAADKFINKHPLLELLKHPNTDVTYSELMQQFASFYLITGNNFAVATGRVTKPAIELYINNPADLSITQNSYDGFAQSYMINVNQPPLKFTRDERNFRFYDTGTQATATRELYQTKTFQPGRNTSKLWGMSRLQPLYWEINQYIQASRHNLSLLMRGGRPSLIITASQPLSDEQYSRLQQQLNDFVSGSNNAGRPLFINAGGDDEIKVTETGQTNKDMDFSQMESRVTNKIYNVYKIPLALISTDSMTLNNLSTALISLYDNAVIPLARRIFDELTQFLMPRYPNSENLILSFDPRTIPALEQRSIQRVTDLSKTNVVTVNEMRKVLNLDVASHGADLLYQPANLIPVANAVGKDDPLPPIQPATQDQTQNNLADNTAADIAATGIEEAKKYIGSLGEEFKIIMKQQKDKDGNRLFKDGEIDQIAKEQGLE